MSEITKDIRTRAPRETVILDVKRHITQWSPVQLCSLTSEDDKKTKERIRITRTSEKKHIDDDI